MSKRASLKHLIDHEFVARCEGESGLKLTANTNIDINQMNKVVFFNHIFLSAVFIAELETMALRLVE